MLQKQSPTPSMKQRSRSCSTLSTPPALLTASQTQREGGERQFFRNLSKDEQTHDEGRLPGCYPAVSFPRSPSYSTHFHLPLTHSPLTETSSRHYRLALQIQEVWPSRMAVGLTRPRSGEVLLVEVIAASIAPRRSLASLVSARVRANSRVTVHEVVLRWFQVDIG